MKITLKNYKKTLHGHNIIYENIQHSSFQTYKMEEYDLDNVLNEGIENEFKQIEKKKNEILLRKEKKKKDKQVISRLKKSYTKLLKQSFDLEHRYEKYEGDDIDRLIGEVCNSELLCMYSTPHRRAATLYHNDDTCVSSLERKNRKQRLFNNHKRYFFSDGNLTTMDQSFNKPITRHSDVAMRYMMDDYKKYDGESKKEFWTRFRKTVQLNGSEVQWSFQKQYAMDNINHNKIVVTPENAVDHFYWERNGSRKKFFHLANIKRFALDGSEIYKNDNIVANTINAIYIDTKLKLAISKLPENAYVEEDSNLTSTFAALRDKSFLDLFKDDFEYRCSLYKILYNLVKGGKKAKEMNDIIMKSRDMIVSDEDEEINVADFLNEEDCDGMSLRNQYPLPKKHKCYRDCLCGAKGPLLENLFGVGVKDIVNFHEYPSHYHTKKKLLPKKKVQPVFRMPEAAERHFFGSSSTEIERRRKNVHRFQHGLLGPRKKRKIKRSKKTINRPIVDNFEENY